MGAATPGRREAKLTSHSDTEVDHHVWLMALLRGRISVIIGDISMCRKDVIVNAANPSLCGSTQPHYWRFKNRINVDTAIHGRAGPGLRRECEKIEEVCTEHCISTS